MNRQTVLITGGLGFIFSNFIRRIAYLNRQDPKEDKYPYKIINVDKATNSMLLNNVYVNKAISDNNIADICDEHIMDNIFNIHRPDIVIHGAAESSVDSSLKDPNVFIKSNVLGTQVLINKAIKYNVKKFIYISTDEVYGHLTNEDELSWTEDSVPNPRNPYSASKFSGECLVKPAAECHGLPYIITRTCNNYGPRQTSNKLIPRVIKSIVNNEPIPVYGKGDQIRDWLHVYDNCDALLTIVESGKIGEIYNISANQEFTNLEIIQKVCNIAEKGHDLITHIPDPRGTGHDFRYSINSSKVKSLGWTPQIKFKDGLRSTVEWFLQNQWFVKN